MTRRRAKSNEPVDLEQALEQQHLARVRDCVETYLSRAEGDPLVALTALATDYDTMMDLNAHLQELAVGKLEKEHQKRVNAGKRDTESRVHEWLDLNHAKYASIEAASIALGHVLSKSNTTLKPYVRAWNKKHQRWGQKKVVVVRPTL